MITVDHSATFHFDICTDAYFHLNSLFINFLHMFVLPDVATSASAGVGFIHIVFCIPDVP